MPRRNRVTPFGEIVAIPQRGTFFGNRGLLHDENGELRRAWSLRRWHVCLLDFRGRHRVVMTPNRYTELFFLDEATALAAGHRPCFECRRTRFLDFRAAWTRGNHPGIEPETVRVKQLDDQLHDERLAASRSRSPDRSELDRLPDGVFISLDHASDTPYLLWNDHLHAWSIEGYRRPERRPTGAVVNVLTPRSTVGAIRAGYRPVVHPTVESLYEGKYA